MLERLYQQVSVSKARRVVIGYSGGLDSQVLLHLLSQLKQQYPDFPPLLAIHVNHQLHDEADAWQNFCANQCAVRGVAFIAHRVHIEGDSNIEAQAREKRFGVFNTYQHAGDVLLLAHHANDQAETLLYRLFRGAGVKGLAAMRESNNSQGLNIFRPLLKYTKQQLADYAASEALSWLDDSSNDDVRFDRNYIRHQLMPLIQQRWPQLLKRLSLSAEYLQQADELLADLARMDFVQCDCVNTLEPCLDLYRLSLLSNARQANLLRFWCAQYGLSLSEPLLISLRQQLIAAKPDAQPMLEVGDYQLRRYQQKIYLCAKVADSFSAFDWDGRELINLPGFGGLMLSPVSNTAAWQFSVRPRALGEKIQLTENGQHKVVKKLLQSHGIAPWQRECLPFIYHDDELIAVGDVLLSAKGRELLSGQVFSRVY